jgi:hypothetical protein
MKPTKEELTIKLHKIKSRVAKDNFIRKVIKKYGVYL